MALVADWSASQGGFWRLRGKQPVDAVTGQALSRERLAEELVARKEAAAVEKRARMDARNLARRGKRAEETSTRAKRSTQIRKDEWALTKSNRQAKIARMHVQEQVAAAEPQPVCDDDAVAMHRSRGRTE